MDRVILASQSPRRRELLRRMAVPCTVHASHIPEQKRPGESPSRYAIRLAIAKAEFVSVRFPDCVVIAADTVVTHRGCIFGKPRNPDHAYRILSALSNTRHEVLTAVSVFHGHTRRLVDLDRAIVITRRLSAARIRCLARKHLDKAGAYAVQERDDAVVRTIKGSYYTVVGLPVHKLHAMLGILGVSCRDIPEPHY